MAGPGLALYRAGDLKECIAALERSILPGPEQHRLGSAIPGDGPLAAGAPGLCPGLLRPGRGHDDPEGATSGAETPTPRRYLTRPRPCWASTNPEKPDDGPHRPRKGRAPAADDARPSNLINETSADEAHRPGVPRAPGLRHGADPGPRPQADRRTDPSPSRKEYPMTRSSLTHRVPAARARRAARPRLDPLEGRLLLAAGDPDPTFGVGGLVTTAFSTTGKNPTQLGAEPRPSRCRWSTVRRRSSWRDGSRAASPSPATT